MSLAYHFSTDYGVLHVVWEHANIPPEAVFAIAIFVTIIIGWAIWTKAEFQT